MRKKVRTWIKNVIFNKMADFKKTIDFIKSVYGNQEFTPLAVPVLQVMKRNISTSVSTQPSFHP